MKTQLMQADNREIKEREIQVAKVIKSRLSFYEIELPAFGCAILAQDYVKHLRYFMADLEKETSLPLAKLEKHLSKIQKSRELLFSNLKLLGLEDETRGYIFFHDNTFQREFLFVIDNLKNVYDASSELICKLTTEKMVGALDQAKNLDGTILTSSECVTQESLPNYVYTILKDKAFNDPSNKVIFKNLKHVIFNLNADLLIRQTFSHDQLYNYWNDFQQVYNQLARYSDDQYSNVKKSLFALCDTFEKLAWPNKINEIGDYLHSAIDNKKSGSTAGIIETLKKERGTFSLSLNEKNVKEKGLSEMNIMEFTKEKDSILIDETATNADTNVFASYSSLRR